MGDAWFHTLLLAELEAETVGADSALARIDEALALGASGRRSLRPRLSPSSSRRNPAQARSRPTLRPRRKPSRPPSPSRSSKAAAAAVCAQRLRSPSSINRPAAPPKPTPSSRRRSKAFLRRRKCPRSPRRRRCSRRWRRAGEVKAEAAQRRRMTHLRVAYGHALIATRGYGAPETTEAFTAARESSSWRQRCARALGGRLRPLGGQLRAGRVSRYAGARGGFPPRRRGKTRFAHGRRRTSRPRGHPLVRRRIRRSTRPSGTRARVV